MCAIAALVAGCDSGSVPADAGGGGTDGGAIDANAADGNVPDAGLADTGAVDTGLADAGALDAGATDSGADSGAADAGSFDAGPFDAGPFDAGPAPRTTCALDADCTGGLCVAGLCFVSSATTDATMGLGSIARLAAAADADGTLRLLTGVQMRDPSTGYTTYPTFDVVGHPGAFTVTAGQVSSDLLGFDETGRAGTPVAHTSTASPDERWILVDQMATVNEDRPIYGFDAVHAADGTIFVMTTPLVPRRPSETYDPYPLHLWTYSGTAWSFEELTRNTGIDRDLHLRVETSSGAPTVLYTDAFWVKCWRLEAAGWTSSILYTFAPAPTRSGSSLWIDDPAGHTHLLHVLHLSASDVLAYVELDDTGVVRDTTFPGTGVYALQGSLSFDAAGNLYFLTIGDITSPSRRPYELHRIATDGTESRTLLGSIRTDLMQQTALAVAPDGTVTIFIYSPTQPMEIRTLAPR